MIKELQEKDLRLLEAVENFDYSNSTFRAFDIHELARKIYAADPYRNKAFCFERAFLWYEYVYDDSKTRQFIKID